MKEESSNSTTCLWREFYLQWSIFNWLTQSHLVHFLIETDGVIFPKEFNS